MYYRPLDCFVFQIIKENIMGPQKMEEIHKDIAELKETLNFLSAEMEAMKKERRDEKKR